MKRLMENLGITRYTEEHASYYKQAMEAYAARGTEIVEAERVLKLNRTYGLFTHRLDDVLRAGEEIKKNPCLLQFIYLLETIMADKGKEIRVLGALDLPQGGAEYDMAPVFAVLSHTPEEVKWLSERGVPEGIIAETLKACEKSMDICAGKLGRAGLTMNYLRWLCPYLDARRLDIGRFNFDISPRFGGNVTLFRNQKGEIKALINRAEIHRTGRLLGAKHFEDVEGSFTAELTETADAFIGYAVRGVYCEKEKTVLKKAEWKAVLQDTDSVIRVHIPGGRDFSEKCRIDSYEQAWDVFNTCYAEYKPRAFACSSWLLDPFVAEIMGNESNIAGFQSDFILLPENSGDGEALEFIFGNSTENLSDLPEDTRLQRAIKKHYMDGNEMYRTLGVRFPE